MDTFSSSSVPSTSSFASADVGATHWDMGHNAEFLPLASQDELHASVSRLLANAPAQSPSFPPTTAPSLPPTPPPPRAKTVFGWRPSDGAKHTTLVDPRSRNKTNCVDMLTDALVPRKPKYVPVPGPCRLRIEQACEACRARKAKVSLLLRDLDWNVD